MGALHMTREERERFLADLHVGLLAVSSEDGAPLVVPIWYRYEPGGDLLFHTDRDSVKTDALSTAGRASVCVQREEYPYAYVTVDGPVAIGDASDDERIAIAVRYLGDEMGRAYVATTDPNASVAVRLTPERWRTTDYSKVPDPVG